MSRTNIDLEDSALEAVMRRFHFSTKTDAVNYALRALAGQPMTREELLGLKGSNLVELVPEDMFP